MAAAFGAYCQTLSGPFIFDDMASIPMNTSIQHFATAWSPPSVMGETVSGRPLLNFSFAVNYAISGKEVWSYHVGNLLIHIAAGLTLFGLVRRTLLLPALRARFGSSALMIGAVSAALWMLHPLQTESVTYIVQRAESLMALFYLLTLYCFSRGAGSTFDGKGARCWLTLSVIACLLGMASKEVMVSAPIIMFLYDRAFVSESFREGWMRRKTYYVCLAATWILLAALVIQTGNRGTTAGFGTEISSWEYLLTQAKAIPHYLRLAVWPGGLVFDYGTETVSSFWEVIPQALLMAGLLAAAVWLLIRKPAAGFLAVFFFAVLAPTSSFIPVSTQTMAEHRMYLALSVLAVGATLACWQVFGQRSKGVVVALGVSVAALLAVVTFQRNQDYQTVEAIWRDTLAKMPMNPRAHNNLGNALADNGAPLEALAHCQRAIELKPKFPQAYNNYGYALSKLKRYDESLAYFDKALSFREHGMEITLANRGYALFNLGQFDTAIMDYEAALKIRPDYEDALNNYGNVLHTVGRSQEALACLDKALAVNPRFASAWNNRGNIFSAQGLDKGEALRCYKRAAELDPELWEALDNVGRYLTALGRNDEAVPYLKLAIDRAPDESVARYRLGNALMLSNRQQESIPEYRRVIELRPDFTGAYHNLAVALVNSGKPAEALPYFQIALRQDPGAAPIQANYADALAKAGRLDEAVAHAQEAVKLDPHFAWARELLATLMSRRPADTATINAPAASGL